MEKKYIEPRLILADKIESINKYINKPEQFEYLGHADDRKYKKIVFNVIHELKHLIVLGEPGCGKSELLTQLIKKTPSVSINLLQKEEFCITDETDLICFDALDEVSNAEFSDAVYLIADTVQKYPSKRIIVTCRTHYINANISLIIASLSNFKYLLIDQFDEDHIVQYVNSTDLKDNLKSLLTSKLNTNSNKQLKRILQIPRYLTELCKVIQDNSISKEELEKWKRADFFEKAIYNKIETEIKKDSPGTVNNELYISKRMLEKLALIMEIKRVNKISIDEFLSFIDETDSNISHVFLSTVNLSKFYDRTLKKTGSYLEFDNTEFQEYLAAKEILRQGNKEQIIYDLLFDKDFEHIYSNWYDVLRFIVELNPEILLSLSKFVLLNNKGWSDENFLKLVKEIDPETLDESQKSVLFKNIYIYFQSHELYIHDFTQILTSLYTVESAGFFESVIDDIESVSYEFRIYNQFKLVALLIRDNQISNKKEYWIKLFEKYALKNSTQIQCAALYAIMDLDLKNSLSLLDKSTQILSNENVYKTYMMVLYHVCPNEDFSIKNFKFGLKNNYLEGINGLLHITEPLKFISTFTEIFESDELIKLLFHEDSHPWGYTIFSNTIEELWDKHSEIRTIVLQFFKFIFKDEDETFDYSYRELILKLLYISKSKDQDFIFILIDLCKDLWILDDKIWMIQEIIEIDQLSKLRYNIDKRNSNYTGEEIIRSVLYGLKFKTGINNPNKEKIYQEGKILFPQFYKNWEDPQEKHEDPQKIRFKRILEEELSVIKVCDTQTAYQYFTLFLKYKGNKFINTLTQVDRKTLEMSIIHILEFIDLSKSLISRKSDSSYLVNNQITYFYNALNIGIELNLTDLLKTKFRTKIIQFMPLGYNYVSYDYNNFQQYNSIITVLYEEDKKNLFDFLTNRKDDYTEFNIISFFEFVRRFKLSILSELIKKYILESNNDYYQKEGLLLLAEDYMSPTQDYFTNYISLKVSEKIVLGNSYDTANAILIKLFNNKHAVNTRIEFIKANYESYLVNDSNDHDYVYFLSDVENEMRNHTFFNCFIESKRHDYVDLFCDLIDFSLKINTEHKFHKYSEYLQTMSLEYFKAIDNRENVIKLRKIATSHSNKHAADGFLRLLKELELFYVNKESNINIYQAISQYNKIKTTKYELINNTTDLYYLVQNAISEFVNTIENEGLYRPINFLSSERYPNEDLLQKTLKLSLENSLFKYGIREIDIIRESNLYDDKRTDILVKYGFIGPIMIELKLLDNDEIQNETKMKEYKGKLNQYIQAYHCDYSFYLIFQRKQSNDTTHEKYQNMIYEYSDIRNLSINFIDCYIDKLYMDGKYNCSNPRKRNSN